MSSQSHSSLALITGLLSARHSSCSKVTSYFWKDNRVSVYPHSSTLCQDDRSQMRDKLVQGWVSWGGQLIVSPISESALWATVLASPRKAAEGKWRYHKTFRPTHNVVTQIQPVQWQLISESPPGWKHIKEYYLRHINSSHMQHHCMKPVPYKACVSGIIHPGHSCKWEHLRYSPDISSAIIIFAHLI